MQQLASYRKIRNEYRDQYIKLVKRGLRKGEVTPVEGMEELLEEVSKKTWNVRNEYPTLNTEVLEEYLSRYINRIATSKSKLAYIYIIGRK